MTTPADNAAIAPDHRLAIHIDRHDNPFAEMSEQERMRLFIRVLCELVAYGEIDDDGKPLSRPMPAHRRNRDRVSTTAS